MNLIEAKALSDSHRGRHNMLESVIVLWQSVVCALHWLQFLQSLGLQVLCM